MTPMSADDIKVLADLRRTSTEAARILHERGYKELAERLSLQTGYACGLAYRLDKHINEKSKEKINDNVDQ